MLNYTGKGKAIWAVLLIFGLAWPAAAADADDTRRLADSLGSFYESAVEDIQPLSETESLDDYLILAAKRSASLRAAFYRWRAALEKADYAGSLPDPVFSYGYFVENVETRVGPQNQRIGIKQSFPWFGTLGAREDVAAEFAGAAYQKYAAEKLRLFYRVKAAYYEYYFLGQKLALTRENFELLTFWESVARAKYKAGLRAHPDLIRAQVELGKLEDRLSSLEDQLRPAASRLRAVVNLPDSIDLPLPMKIDPAENELSRDSVLPAVRFSNPDLKSLQSMIEREEADRRLAGKASYPGFTVGVDYIETGEALNSTSLDSGKDSWSVGMSINLPIWFSKNNAKKREAEARRKQAVYTHVDAANQLQAATEQALFAYADALRQVRLYRDGLIPKAEQSLNANYTAYQAGELDFLNLLDAQRLLLEFELTLERARTNLGVRAAEIEMLTGRELAGLVKRD